MGQTADAEDDVAGAQEIAAAPALTRPAGGAVGGPEGAQGDKAANNGDQQFFMDMIEIQGATPLRIRTRNICRGGAVPRLPAGLSGTNCAIAANEPRII